MGVSRTIPTSKTPDLITFTVSSGGNAIPVETPITHIRIQREINKIPTARIVLEDGDRSKETFEISDGALFIPGTEVELSLGYQSDNALLFKGIITSHGNRQTKKKSELLLDCKDAFVKMTLGRKSKHFNNKTDKVIAEDLIGEYPGLEKDIADTVIEMKDLIQYDQTDWDFIVSRMDLLGFICVVKDGKLTTGKPDLSGTTVVDVLFGATIVEYHAEMDARIQSKTLQSANWSHTDQAVKTADAAEPSIATEPGNIPNTDLAAVAGADPYLMVHSGQILTEELQAWADAKLQKQRLSKIRGRVRFQGFPDVEPGTYIGLNGVGDRFNGPVFVSGVLHEYQDGDWVTEVSFGWTPEWFTESINPYHPSAAMGMVPSVQGLMVGIVTDLEDKDDGEHRIKVRLPVISAEDEGIWARVATLDAGENRGTFFRPELEDEVIVGFINNDPRQMVVLGMLHSSAKPAPLEAKNDNDEKGYVSRSKMKIIFNDKDKTIVIEIPDGENYDKNKKITISDKDGAIKIEDLKNKHSIVLDDKGVTIDSAKDIKLTAKSKISLEAPNISINGSAQTEVKGGVVKIN